ncbi:MAG: PRC-barrel domain-containing protein [Candidatus Methanoperedens sp.]|jgi:sporulation protein YlmC with PRC-barrel domain|nr:PRC-barrel domain-containing protein [Candidatus Methanoperedens sp.]MCZ7397615.1 PRC-barrel domain-containing protein [Candidatus Methanoperedens sp.]
MAKILARNLSNKRVMLTDGSELGTANDVVMDTNSGALLYLVVKPNSFVDTSKYKMQDNFLLVPFDAVRAAKDYAIVDKKLITGSDFE